MIKHKRLSNAYTKQKKLLKAAFSPKYIAETFLFMFLIITAIIFRIILWQQPGGSDFTNFLNPWLNSLRENGFQGLDPNRVNYNTPYLLLLYLASFLIPDNLLLLYIIGFLSDLLLAFGIFKLIAHFKSKGPLKYFTFVAALLLPTAVLNSTLLTQCDTLLGAAVVWALYYALKRRLNISWLIAGLSCSFKLQGVFLAPIIMIVSLNRKSYRIRGPLIFLVTLVLSTLPAVLLGRPPHDVIGVFISGTGPMFGHKVISWYTANLGAWFPNKLYWPMSITLTVIGLFFCLFVCYRFGIRPRRPLNDRQIISISALVLLTLTFILPNMHERYYYQAEIALFVLAFLDHRAIPSAIIMQIVTISSMFSPAPPDQGFIYCTLSIPVFYTIVTTYLQIFSSPKTKKQLLRA